MNRYVPPEMEKYWQDTYKNGPMTLDQRIEAARKRLWQQPQFHDGLDRSGFAWDVCEDAARGAMKAAFPELFADPPTHKIVPLKTTPAMDWAGTGMMAPIRIYPDTSSGDEIAMEKARETYRAMVEAAP